MAHHGEVNLKPADSRRLEGLAWPIFAGGFIVGLVALAAAFGLSLIGGESGLKRFGFAYLQAFAFFLSLALGSILLVVLTHLFRAGWVILVRRVPEVIGASMPTLAVLFLPILIYTAMWNGWLYPWAQTFPDTHGEPAGFEHPYQEPTEQPAAPQGAAPAQTDALVFAAPDAAAQAHAQTEGHAAEGEHADHGAGHADPTAHLVHEKEAYLNLPFFTVRAVIYFALWSLIALWYWRTSTRQDVTGDANLTRKMEIYSAVATITLGITITFAAFDWLMSLDPTWFSTMFGIYYFAGAMQATLAAVILALMGLQAMGFLPSVTREHYHDLGKLLLAFIVFWMYIAFSQYMLVWYAAIPAEQPWMIQRGVSTFDAHYTPWSWVALSLLFLRFFVPFVFLMSRWQKRNKLPLAIGAAWLLAMQWIDMWWVVLPSYDPAHVHVPWLEILCTVGVGGIVVAAVVRIASRHSLVPLGDPRLVESLAHRNI